MLEKTYQERAYDHLKSRILNLDLKPGEYITDQQIADDLEISRTPVREAFRRLQHEGLLNYEARKGWKVYTLTLDDIHEIFDIKVAIEGMVAYKAAQCTNEKLRSQLETALEKMRVAVETNDLDLWIEADPVLHEVIYAMARNTRAHRMVENLNDQWHRVRIGFVARTERISRSLAEHEAFVNAILEGDSERSRDEIVSHLNIIRDELVNLLTTMVLPFAKEGI